MSDLKYSIKVAANRSGLSPHVIRMWEKRYATVLPERRGQGRRRAYSDSDVERLSLLRDATRAGHSIGNIASLSIAQIRGLIDGDESANRGRGSHRVSEEKEGSLPEELLEQAFAAVQAMNAAELERVLEQALLKLGIVGILRQLVVPLIDRIGDQWAAGKLLIGHEHIASAVLRTFLGHASRPMAVSGSAPIILVATPADQLHELGAVLVSATAANAGWSVLYAGAALPASEIASAAIRVSARAVALSIVHPADDPEIPGELRRLRRLLPPTVPLLVGGRAAPGYSSVLAEIGARVLTNLDALTHELAQLRSEGP